MNTINAEFIQSGSTRIFKIGNELDLDKLMGDAIEESSFGEGHFTLNSFSRVKLAGHPINYRGHELYEYYSICGWDAGAEGREEFQGPMVPGPRAHAFKEGVMIHNGPYLDEVAFYVEDGYTVIIRGVKYIVKMDSRGYIKFENA
jgi:hypothetical protein